MLAEVFLRHSSLAFCHTSRSAQLGAIVSLYQAGPEKALPITNVAIQHLDVAALMAGPRFDSVQAEGLKVALGP
jgi:hypothetical protein